MSRKLTVVLSQAPGKNPAKRGLEESLAAALIMEPGVDVSIVPNLYDMGPDHTGRMFLESVPGDMVVLSWLFPRAAFWLLDRDGIKGQFGVTLLKPPADDDEEEKEKEKPLEGIGATGTIPDRHIYTLDLRDFNKAEPYVHEIRRIIAEATERTRQKAIDKAVANPVMISLGLPSKNGHAEPASQRPATEPAIALAMFHADDLLAPANRRWYPVIDYNRCTNCLECLDFCLFGVYGVDSFDRILTENQDQCKKGCPACSRVCPQTAIMFPEYKTPTIAGADVGAIGGLKIDLSKLFGGGDTVDALTAAVAERDRELVADGRDAVGLAVGIPKRQTGKSQQPKDDLDRLVDDLDLLGL